MVESIAFLRRVSMTGSITWNSKKQGVDQADFVCNRHPKFLSVQIPLHRITDSASNGSVFPVVTEHFSASSDHAFL